jgi:hypothetical protein
MKKSFLGPLLFCLGFGIIGALLLREYGLHKDATLGAFAIVSFLVATGGLAFKSPPFRAISDAETKEVLDQLCRLVENGWQQRRIRLLLGASRPATIHYGRLSSLEDPSVECDWLTGTTKNIHDRWQETPAGRLVLVGDSGSGKTLAAVTLAIQLIEAGKSDSSVPVPVTMSGWDARKSLTDWLTDRLVEEFRLRRRVAVKLIRGRQVIPILDGLDEMREASSRLVSDGSPVVDAAAARALSSLSSANDAINMPLVLTCRLDFYARLLAGDESVHPLLKAVVVEMKPLNSDDIIDFIRRMVPVSANRRSPLDVAEFAAGIADVDSCLGQVLRRPLLLGIAVSVMMAGELSPKQMASFRRPGSLRRALMKYFIPAIVRMFPKNVDWKNFASHAVALRLEGASEQARRYTDVQVTSWLKLILDGLRRETASGDVIRITELWRLGMMYHPRRWHTVIAVFLGAAVGGLGSEWFDGVAGVAVAGSCSLLGVGFGLWAGLRRAPRPSRLNLAQLATRDGWRRILLGLLCGAAGGFAGFQSSGIWAGLSSGVAAAMAATILFGLGRGIVQEVRPNDLLRNDLLFGLALGLVAAIAAGLPGGLTGGLTGGLASSLHLATHLTRAGSIVLAFLISIAGGVALGSRAWLRYRIAVAMLAYRRRLPWRLTRFLYWAYNAGLLRSSGVHYQLRHEELGSVLK